MKTLESVIRASATPVVLGLLLPLGLATYSGCKKEEPPPPLPSAAPVTTPSAPLVLEVEDAGVEDVVDADADAKKVYTGSPASMKKCCQAVAQNAANAPEPTKTYMQGLAAACMAAAASGTGWSGGGFSCR
jgi:hypothetical protein